MRTVAVVVALVACVHAGLWTLLQRQQAVANVDAPLASISYSPYTRSQHPDYGDRLASLTERLHVWAVESPANRSAAAYEDGGPVVTLSRHATLVVDMAPIKNKMLEMKAVFVPGRRATEGDSFALIGSRSRERRAIDATIECIGCGMCVSACTMVSHDPRFPGPAALNRVFTLQRDSRDGAHGDRGKAVLAEDVLTRCHGQANCTAVCPMEISPTDSILALRRRAVLGLFGLGPR